MEYLYRIAGISVLCEIPFPVNIRQESADFIQPAENDQNEPDLKVCFCPVAVLGQIPSGGYWDIDRYHIRNFVYYCTSPHGEPYARMKIDSEYDTQITCEYIRGRESCLNYSRNLCDIIALDTLLLNYSGLLLHASFVRWREWGILFSAPSGTGKSTQADLWEKYEGADIINGDRAGLRLKDENWYAYGLPYAGSSGVYRNESAPVKAIIILRQAKENHIRPLSPPQAVRYLYPELTIHHWDRDFTERAMNLLIKLSVSIPVCLLECLPDRGAVNMVKEMLIENEERKTENYG